MRISDFVVVVIWLVAGFVVHRLAGLPWSADDKTQTVLLACTVCILNELRRAK